MNLLVCVSRTPETTAKISFTSDGKEFSSDGVNYIMNPYDEWYALVRAIELKEQFGGEVTVVHVGPASNDTIIRKALAIGADKAFRIDHEPKSALQTAIYIATFAEEKNYDAIVFGKETIDYNGSEVGAMVAEILSLPFVSYASNWETEDGASHTITRDIEGGVELVEVAQPFVLSAAKGLAEQRIPNMRGIMMAKRKPLEVITMEEVETPIEVAGFRLPDDKGDVKMIDPDNMDELVRILHEEAKVI